MFHEAIQNLKNGVLLRHGVFILPFSYSFSVSVTVYMDPSGMSQNVKMSKLIDWRNVVSD